jgi:hypothetical protein
MGMSTQAYGVGAPYRPLTNTLTKSIEKQIFKQKPAVGTRIIIMKNIKIVPHTDLPKLSS